MAGSQIELQYKYSGKGPVDAKSLVKTYNDLLLSETWYNDAGKVSAYNGMIVAVWLDSDSARNGIYFLHDSTVTNILKVPDVTNEANWHKLGGLNDLPGLAEQVATIKTNLETLQSEVDELQDTSTVVVDTKEQLPDNGISGRLYVVTEEATTYVWYNNEYLPVGDGGTDDASDIEIIDGGGPSA